MKLWMLKAKRKCGSFELGDLCPDLISDTKNGLKNYMNEVWPDEFKKDFIPVHVEVREVGRRKK